ncbi:calpastatin isoform X3 [Pseudoliparis swirei]|uniref:calpastatin isoform X3 n=1 Tax=Pseudoliparis swirei TaxID=2059687 RepID=UPI0024BEADDD|nr:calpastatin isoform X3 [Pseudoliparis swirei]
MGQLLTWIRGPRDGQALQDVSVEQQSQPSRDTPKPAAQVSGVKLAAFEKAAPGSGLKPRVVTATSSPVAAAGSTAVGMAGKAKPETTAPPASATVIDMLSAGATFVEMGSSGPRGGPKETKSAAATTTVRADVHKVAPAVEAAGASVRGKKEAAPTKVQVEVPPAAARGAPEVDPFDALASILPSADSIAPRQPVYTGPEVTELNVTSEKGHKTGELDITLPPGYRFEDMSPVPADYKPTDLPKPMSSGEALDSLSDAFMTSSSPAASQRPEKPMSSGDALDSLSDAFMTSSSPTKPQKPEKPMSSGDALDSLSDAFMTSSSPTKPQKPEKKDSFAGVSASSAGPANFAPPPVKTARPPADKKAKMEAAACDFSLMSAMDAKVDTKPETGEGDAMSLDALSALCDTLPEDTPRPELPELRPEDVVSEDKHTKEKGVLVGEREDSIPPEYRSKEEELKKLPAPEPEPTMCPGEALDILSGGFVTSSSAPAASPSAPPAQTKIEDLKALDLLEDVVAPTKVSGVQAPAPPPAKKTPQSTVCPPGAPRVKPEPDKPTMGTGEALGLLSSDLMTPSVAPAVQAPPVKKAPVAVCPPAGKKAKVTKKEDDFSLEAGLDIPTITKVEPALSSCLASPVQTGKAAAGKDAADGRREPEKGDAMSLDALSALCDTLPEDTPRPELPELRPEDVVSEDKHTKEKGVLVGEREDSIAPEYRSKEEELKKLPAQKPEPTMGTGEALGLLSSDLMTPSVAPAVQAPPVKKAPVAVCPPAGKKAKVTKKEDDFSLEAGLDFPTVTKVEPALSSCLASPVQTGKAAAGKDAADGRREPEQGDAMSLDALSALCDTLPEDTPRPELPELRPEDVVSEDKHTKEKGVLVGEREDSIAPEYRSKEEELKKLPAPEPEPTMGTGEALGLLSSDLMTPSVAPAVQAPPVKKAPVAVCPRRKKAKVTKKEDDFSLEAGLDFPTVTKVEPALSSCLASPVQTGKAATGKDAADGRREPEQGDAMSLDALSALCDTLPEDTPRPELPELRPEDVVSEDKHTKEKGVLVGEREDSIPPEYRSKEEELKKLPAQKPEPTMGTGEALGLLSSDLMTPSVAPAVQAPPVKKAPVAVCPPAGKKAKVTKKEDDFSLEAGLDFPTVTKVEPALSSCLASPVQTGKAAAGKDAADGRREPEQGDAMSLDASARSVTRCRRTRPDQNSPSSDPRTWCRRTNIRRRKECWWERGRTPSLQNTGPKRRNSRSCLLQNPSPPCVPVKLWTSCPEAS